ncbi:MAG: OB-fold domain-containing protein [bacterium]|nr:OB-fold domain-containing protein [bacterium]
MKFTGTHKFTTPEGQEYSLLGIEMTQRYRHTVGFSDPFYQGIDQGLLRATRCSGCGASWFPPRRYCPEDQSETVWYDLSGTGRIVAATRVHIPPPFGGVEVPYVLASIRLDEVDGGITHRVLTDEPPESGSLVAARFDGVDPDRPPLHPLLRLAFEIQETTK